MTSRSSGLAGSPKGARLRGGKLRISNSVHAVVKSVAGMAHAGYIANLVSLCASVRTAEISAPTPTDTPSCGSSSKTVSAKPWTRPVP